MICICVCVCVCVCVSNYMKYRPSWEENGRSAGQEFAVHRHIFRYKKIYFSHCEHDFNSTNLSLRIQKLILTLSNSQLVFKNNHDYSNAFDIVSHTFLLILGACGLCVRLTGFVVTEVSVSRILSSSFGVLCCYTLLTL